MSLFTALIFAFSQPYFSDKNAGKKQHNFIYLDNSLSTNTKGEKGDLLQIAAQEIIENSADKDEFSLLTNTNYFENISKSELKNKLLLIENTGKLTDLKTVLLRFTDNKNTETKTLNNYTLISDFQITNKNNNKEFTNVTHPFSVVQLQSEIKNNISLDSIFISNQNNQNFTLNVVIRNQGNAKKNVPISLFDAQKLVSKLTFSIEENSNKTITFEVPKSAIFLGKIQLNFNDTFTFDNSFYFVQNSVQKISVLSIGKSSEFLSKIYTKDEFNFTENSLENTDYNSFKNQQLIVLNELEKITSTLSNQVIDFSKNGGFVVVIPNENSDLNSYNSFLSKMNLGNINQKKNDSLKITTINYSHPLLENVFSKQVTNFQYPFTKINFSNSINGSSIIDFENQTSFVKEINTQNSKMYWFSSPLNSANSNFQNSPLIVPVFYNIGLKSLQSVNLYYTTDTKSSIDIEISLNKDAILSVQNSEQNIIPLQQQFQNKVSISISDEILKSGFYQILNKKDTVKTIAFNYQKEESNMLFHDMKTIATDNKDITFSNSIADLLNSINKKNEVHWIWKWFLALAIVSLLLEIFILKFFKP